MPGDADAGAPSAGASRRSSAGLADHPLVNADLAHACGELEIVRRTCLAPLLKRIAVSVAAVAALAGSITAYATFPDPLIIAGGSGVAMLVLWIYWTRLPRNNYRQFYRSHFVPAAVRALGRYGYEPNGTMPRIWMGRSGLLPEHHVYLSQDMFSTERDGIAIQFAQAELKRYGHYPTTYGNSQGAAPGLAFGGLLILLSLRTSFAGRTVLKPDRGPLLNMFSDAPADLDIVRQGVKAARGRYEVLSTDPDEARRLLSPTLVARLSELALALGGRRLRISFYDAQILVMIPLRNALFRAPSIFRRPDENATGARLLRTLQTIDEVADALHRQVTAGS